MELTVRAKRRWTILATAVLVAGVCGGCTPKTEYDVANSTVETVVVNGEEIRAGSTREFETYSECEEVYAYADGHRRVAVQTMCDDEYWDIGAEDFEPGRWATVVNATDRTVDVWFGGAERVTGEMLRPGDEVTVSVAAEDDGCARGPDGQAVLWAEYERPTEGPPAVAYHWGEVCDGDRWVIDDDAIADDGAVLTVVNDSGVDLLYVDLSIESDVADNDLSPGESADFPLSIPRDECVDGSVTARTAGQGADLLTVAKDVELCDGTVTLTRGDLRHRVNGAWVPLDYDPSEWTKP